MDQGDNDNPQPDREWVIRIRDEFVYRFKPLLRSDAKDRRTIGRVPHNWRAVHDSAFDYEMMCIGPMDRFSSFYLPGAMEEHKMRFVNRRLGWKLESWRSDGDMSRTTEGERAFNDRESGEDDDGGQIAKTVPLDDLVEAMLELAQKSEACYRPSLGKENDLSFDYHGPLEMAMVIDGCFVVELLRHYYHRLHTKSIGVAIEDDPFFTNPRILTTLRRDLLLLENQLPFFVLEKLYELINKMNNIDHQQAVPLEVLAVTFFDPLLPQPNAVSKLDAKKPEALHLLEVFHSTFLQSVSEKVQKKGKRRVSSRLKPNGSIAGLVSHFASDLQEAGVKFKKRKHHDLLDIEFDHRTLWVPPLSINDHTISLLLNFVAFELSVDHPQPVFTNYLMFWNSLINSTGDIRLLHKHGIINHVKSEEDVAKLLMTCREVIYDRDLGYLYDEIKKVNEYCNRYSDSKYLVWWRSLIRERFSSPWTCLSLFAAIILLLLTLLQTFYAVYSYYRPH